MANHKNTDRESLEEKQIDYSLLRKHLIKMASCIQTALKELDKEHPDEVAICDNAIEYPGNILDSIGACIFSHGLIKVDADGNVLAENFDLSYNTIK